MEPASTVGFGTVVLYVLWSFLCVAVGFFIAAANPKTAEKWNLFRKKAAGG